MRHGAKLLGLCMLVALSLMAISATAAQAENEFLIGEPLKALVGEKEIEGEAEKGFILNETLSITCPGGKETEASGVVKGTKPGTGSAKALFKGCKVFGSETHCKIWDDLGKDGDPSTLLGEGMITASGNATLIKDPKAPTEHYLLVEGLGANKVFSLFDIGGDALCPVGTNEEPFHVEITGSTVVKLLDALTALVTHKISTLLLSTLKELFPNDKLKMGENEAHLSAKSGKEAESVINGTVHLKSNEKWGSN